MADYCAAAYMTPCGATMVAVPYNIWAKQEDDALTAPTVKLTSLRSHNMGSFITTCHGDEAGAGGGVKSGTHNGICEPKEHSSTVRSEGKNMIRHDDIWWMNNKNTIGKLLWMKESDRVDLTKHSQEGWRVAEAGTETKSDAGAASPRLSAAAGTVAAATALEGSAAPVAETSAARGIWALRGLTAGEAAVAGVGVGTSEIGVGDAILLGLLIYMMAKGRTQSNVNVSQQQNRDDSCNKYRCGVKGSPYRGGAHGCVGDSAEKSKGDGSIHSHHVPAKSYSPLSEDMGPAIQMDAADHYATNSFGARVHGPNYAAQRQLLANGQVMAAIALDVANVRSIAAAGNNPTKYDDAINQMMVYAGCLRSRGIIE